MHKFLLPSVVYIKKKKDLIFRIKSSPEKIGDPASHFMFSWASPFFKGYTNWAAHRPNPCELPCLKPVGGQCVCTHLYA